MKCELCGRDILEYKSISDDTLCHECYCKVNDLNEPKFTNIKIKIFSYTTLMIVIYTFFQSAFLNLIATLILVNMLFKSNVCKELIAVEEHNRGIKDITTKGTNKIRFVVFGISVIIILIYAFVINVSKNLNSHEVAKAMYAYNMTISVKNILQLFKSILACLELISPILLIAVIAFSGHVLKLSKIQDKAYGNTLVLSFIIGTLFASLCVYSGALITYGFFVAPYSVAFIVSFSFAFTFGAYLAFSTVWPLRAIKSYSQQLTIVDVSKKILCLAILSYMVITIYFSVLIISKYFSYGKWFFHLW